MNIKISQGNSKLGSIPSVSLPAGITCTQGCECGVKCYAKKLERLRPAVRTAYARNLSVLHENPDTYWREVEASIMMSRFFRFHVSGDIPDDTYFAQMIDVASRNPHCQILCFTKKYEIVNRYISHGIRTDVSDVIPDNLQVVFSVWRNFPCHNPFALPQAHVRYRDGTTTAPNGARECGGNCSECAVTDGGCWSLGLGEHVVFNEH